MVQYQFFKDGNKIEFWTSSDELAEDVEKYIKNCIDAIGWRNRIEKVKIIESKEEGETTCQ